MTNDVRAVPPAVTMSGGEDRLYRRMVQDLAATMDRLTTGAPPKAGTLVGMAAMRVVSEAVWNSLPVPMRNETNFRARLRKLVEVSADNLMLDLRGSRPQ